VSRDWGAELLALLRRERHRLENLLAGRPAGDDGLPDEMDRFLADYDAWRAEQGKGAT
jgi:hypothetical protein